MSTAPQTRPVCSGCRTELASALLVCPVCQTLVHADELKSLAARASASHTAGDLSAALVAWRAALAMLPPGTKQADQIAATISGLTKAVDQNGGAPPPVAGRERGRTAMMAGGLSTIGLLVLTKGKLLLLGLTKAPTLLSMVFAMGAYWTVWGWRFAVGLVLLIYVHEMGHVVALRRYGIAATAPMFVPGLGAFVRLNQRLVDAREDARVGLAGPVWGTAGALGVLGLATVLQLPSLTAIAKAGAWINLFNLLPAWQLDGGRAFNALSKGHRLVAAAALLGLWAATQESLLIVIALVATVRAFGASPAHSDRRTLAEYLVLAAVLGAMTLLQIPEVAGLVDVAP